MYKNQNLAKQFVVILNSTKDFFQYNVFAECFIGV